MANGFDRRGFLKTAAVAATGALAAPRLSLAADAKTLRFIPQANLANLDPIWTTQYVVRNGALLIWDMLYGVDSESNETSHPGGWKRGMRIGSAKDGKVRFFIPDPETKPTGTSAAEGVAVDADGHIYGAEVGPKAVKRYVK